MAHGDNRGLRLPPRVAPIQVVIVPVAANKPGVIEKATELYSSLKQTARVELDDRMQYSPGYKFNYWEMKGVPIRVEIGPRDIEQNKCVIVRRDTFEKIEVSLDNLNETITKTLDEIQNNMFKTACEVRDRRTNVAHSLDEIDKVLKENQGYVKTMWCGDEECEEKIKDQDASHLNKKI